MESVTCCSGNWEWSETEREEMAEMAAVRDTGGLTGVEAAGVQELGETKSSVLRWVTKLSSCRCR